MGESIIMPLWMISELRDYLRLDHDGDDAALHAFARSAAELCQAYIGQQLLASPLAERVTPRGDWTMLSARPVVSIDRLAMIGSDGVEQALASGAYAVDIDGEARGWWRALTAQLGGRWVIHYRAGLADDWNAVPEALRLGIIRMAAHCYHNRDGDAALSPPPAVGALWRPWRRVAL
jgi:uncharacterized phiE125 gp8 family phage protein